MSRMVLAAMRKHSTPSDFVRKFLLPVVRRGSVPARSMNYWKSFGHPKLEWPKGNLTNITFYDLKNPKRICYFSLKRTMPRSGRISPPKASIFKNLFVRIGSEEPWNDWQQGKETAGTITAEHLDKIGSTTESIALSHDALTHWGPVMKARGEGRHKGKEFINYGISHELFNELDKYQRAADDFAFLGNAFDFLEGKVTKEHLANRLKLQNLREPTYKTVLRVFNPEGRQRLANVLLEGLRVTPKRFLKREEIEGIAKTIGEKIKQEFGISERFAAEQLAPIVVFNCANYSRIVEGVLRDLREFPKVSSVPERGNHGR